MSRIPRTDSLHSDFENAFRNRAGQELTRAEIRAILQETFENFPNGSVVPTDHAERSARHVNQCCKCDFADYQIFETLREGDGRQGVARYRVRAFKPFPGWRIALAGRTRDNAISATEAV